MKKRIIALLTLLVLLVGMFAVSEAAAIKPVATLRAKYLNQTVKLGKTISFVFDLNAGTYNKVGDVFRSKLIVQAKKGKEVGGVASWVFTGKQVYKVQVKIDKKAPTGKYKLLYNTYYRKNATANWIRVKPSHSAYFTVTKK